MGERGDNQHTPNTRTQEEEVAYQVQCFQALLGPRKVKASSQYLDWNLVFTQWLTSQGSWPDFCKSKGIHPGSVQHRGGRMWWINARENVRLAGLAKAIARAPEAWEQKYEKQLRIMGKLEDIIETAANDMIDNRLNGKRNPFETVALDKLSECVKKLTELNMKIRGEDAGGQPAVTVNLHNILMQSIQKRDQEFGVH